MTEQTKIENIDELKKVLKLKKNQPENEPISKEEQPSPQRNMEVPEDIVNCPKCNGIVFVNGVVLRKISALVSPSGKADLQPVSTPLFCFGCGHNMSPEELGLIVPSMEELAKENSGIIIP